MLYHVSVKQGRGDSFYIESPNVATLKSLLNTLSTVQIQSIKEVVYSKKYGINYSVTNYLPVSTNIRLNVWVKNDKDETTILGFYFPKQNLTNEVIIETIKNKLLLNDSPITSIVSTSTY